MQAVFIIHMYIYKAEAAIDSPKATNCRKARNCCQFSCIFFHCHMAPLLTKPTRVIKEKRKGGLRPFKRLARWIMLYRRNSSRLLAELGWFPIRRHLCISGILKNFSMSLFVFTFLNSKGQFLSAARDANISSGTPSHGWRVRVRCRSWNMEQLTCLLKRCATCGTSRNRTQQTRPTPELGEAPSWYQRGSGKRSGMLRDIFKKNLTHVEAGAPTDFGVSGAPEKLNIHTELQQWWLLNSWLLLSCFNNMLWCYAKQNLP